MKNLLTFILLFVILTTNSFSQRDEVNRYLLMIAQGKTQLVKEVILELLAKYPNDPGVKLLHGTIIENAYLAMDIYKKIINDYPSSEWADDAQWRIVQFYSIVGDTLQATKELEFMRTNYQTSPFLGPASDVVRLALGVAKSEIRQTMDFNRPVQNIPVLAAAKENQKANDIKADPFTNDFKNINNSATMIDSGKVKPKDITPTNGHSNDIAHLNNSNKDEIAFYGLQVAIYTDKESAENEKNKFLAQRMRTQVVEKIIDDKNMFAVVIGHYSSIESAEAAKIIVAQQCKCEPIIYKK